MSKIGIESSNECFAALKLIEKLCKDGLIPDYIFRNILNDYVDVVDGAAFASCCTNAQPRKENHI